jgi:hypothetical protein
MKGIVQLCQHSGLRKDHAVRIWPKKIGCDSWL